MGEIYLNELYKLLSKIDNEYRTVRKSANTPVRSRLMVAIDRGRTNFIAVSYKDGKRVRRYINKDRDRIYRLANKAYLIEYACRLRFDREVLSEAVHKLKALDYAGMLEDLPDHFELLDPELVRFPARVGPEFSCPNPSKDVCPV